MAELQQALSLGKLSFSLKVMPEDCAAPADAAEPACLRCCGAMHTVCGAPPPAPQHARFARLILLLQTVAALMRLHDRDSNGCISFEEFKSLNAWLQQVTDTFKRYSSSSGGGAASTSGGGGCEAVLDRAAARQSLAAAGHVQPLDGPAFDALFSSFDPDRSNDLCLAEYVALSAFLQVGACDGWAVAEGPGGRAAVPAPGGGWGSAAVVCAASCLRVERGRSVWGAPPPPPC